MSAFSTPSKGVNIGLDEAAGREFTDTGATARHWSARARYVLFGIGLSCLLGALALFAVFVSEIRSSHTPSVAVVAESDALASRYRGDEGSVYDRPAVTPTRSPRPSATPVHAAPPLKDVPFRLVIDSIGVNAPVGTYGLDATGSPVVPLNAAEVAWYDWSAQPGTGSNAVFAGHVTWSGQAVFYRLNTLGVGESVRLVGDDGTELVYTVRESYLVDPADPAALNVMFSTQEDVITIITCDGSFYYTGDPVFRGDYTNRRVVRASLTTIDQPPAAAG